MLDIIAPVSPRTNGCPEKSGAAHYHVFARPPEGEQYSPEDFQKFWKMFEDEFGLHKQPFTEAIHDNDGHEHRVYSLVKPDGACIRMDNDFARREKIGRIIEHERGERLTRGAHNRSVIHYLENERPEVAQAMQAHFFHEGPKPIARLTPEERHQEERTQVRKSDVARTTAEAWQTSDNGHSFAHALREQGLTLARGDKVPLVVDATGNTHSLARMLSMHGRASGEPAPRSQDIQARLAGIELPSLDEARQRLAVPVEVAPINPQPEPPQPGPGVHVPVVDVIPSQDIHVTSVDMATPSNDGQPSEKMPAAASASSPKAPKGAGGGGGSSPSNSDSQVSPLPSLDVGNGPGEPPGVNASPEQKSQFAAKLADYEDRKAKAWLSWLKAWDSQAKKGNPKSTGGSSDVGIDEKGLREAASALIQSIEHAAEKSAANRAFYAAWTAFRNDQSPAPRAPEGPTGPLESADHGRTGEHSDTRHGRGNAAAEGGGWTAGDDRNHERNRGHSDAPGRNRTALEIASERIATDRALSLSDPSALRAAMRGPCPLAGLEGKERKAKLDELNGELHAEFRASQRTDFSEAVARERMRAHPLAKVLRERGKHLPPDERAQAWADIKAAHAALILKLKEQQKANQKAGFRQFVECMSHVDSRAHALWEEMKAAAERNRKIASELARADEKIAHLRASEPQGERDPEKAAKAAIKALHEPLIGAQEKLREAIKTLESTPRPRGLRWWNPWAHSAHKAAKTAVDVAHARVDASTPDHLKIAFEESKARSSARVASAWDAGPGKELRTLVHGVQAIRDALEAKDYRTRDTLLNGGLEAALELVRKREAEEQRRREIEEARAAKRGNIYGFPDRQNQQDMAAPVPRMR